MIKSKGYYAEKADPFIPNADGTPSDYRFGDEITLWIPVESKIAGYTYENGQIVLIAMYQDGAYTVKPPTPPKKPKTGEKP